MSTNVKTRGAKQASGATLKDATMAAAQTGVSPPHGTPNPLTELQATLEKTMREMSQLNSVLKELQEDVNSVKTSQAKISMDIAGIYERLDETDGRILELETENNHLRAELLKTTKKCEELDGAVQNIVNQSKRQNLRLVGVKERLEGDKPREYIRGLIEDVLDVKLAETELQRVHRSFGSMPDDDSPPRPIIMRFHSYLERERVMAAVREKYKSNTAITWHGKRISFFPDVTKDVADRRKKFNEVRAKLHELDVRFTLAFPAVMRFTWKGKKMSFDDHRKAMACITEKSQRSD